MTGRILGILVSLLIGLPCMAQNGGRKEVGLRLGAGFSNEVLPERKEYKPIIILPYFNYYITPTEKAARISIYAEPQVTPVIIDYQNSSRQVIEHELGVNAGIIFNYRLNNFNAYLGTGSGPNFITMKTRQQADGFLFSDNFFAGVQREIKGSYRADIQFRIRHISNAGLKEPNNGIDNFFAVAGISKLIGKTSPTPRKNQGKKVSD